MTYNETLFRARVAAMRTNEVLFETIRVGFIKHSDGRLWITGTNVPYDAPIEDVTEYINALQSVIDAAHEWGLDDEQIKDELERIHDEIADYEVD